MYIYMYIYMCTYIYMYIYMHHIYTYTCMCNNPVPARTNAFGERTNNTLKMPDVFGVSPNIRMWLFCAKWLPLQNRMGIIL